MSRTDVMKKFAAVLTEHFGVIEAGKRAIVIVDLMEVHDDAVEEQIADAYEQGVAAITNASY